MSTTILLIEPDKVLAQTCKKTLEINSYTVHLATDTRAAIASADSKKPDLVILEIELARHNGIEFLYEFRSYADWQDVPVIIYSHVPASRFGSAQKQLKLLSVSHYLDKSKVGLEELMQAVASELEDA